MWTRRRGERGLHEESEDEVTVKERPVTDVVTKRSGRYLPLLVVAQTLRATDTFQDRRDVGLSKGGGSHRVSENFRRQDTHLSGRGETDLARRTEKGPPRGKGSGLRGLGTRRRSTEGRGPVPGTHLPRARGVNSGPSTEDKDRAIGNSREILTAVRGSSHRPRRSKGPTERGSTET